VAVKLGISPAKQDEVAKVLLNLYELFLSKDASMVEINPFAEVSTIRFFSKIKNRTLPF
jgi:succinyl-CoA synthetase beta subunit